MILVKTFHFLHKLQVCFAKLFMCTCSNDSIVIRKYKRYVWNITLPRADKPKIHTSRFCEVRDISRASICFCVSRQPCISEEQRAKRTLLDVADVHASNAAAVSGHASASVIMAGHCDTAWLLAGKAGVERADAAWMWLEDSLWSTHGGWRSDYAD